MGNIEDCEHIKVSKSESINRRIQCLHDPRTTITFPTRRKSRNNVLFDTTDHSPFRNTSNPTESSSIISRDIFLKLNNPQLICILSSTFISYRPHLRRPTGKTNFLSRGLHSKLIHLQSLTLERVLATHHCWKFEVEVVAGPDTF